MDDYRLIDFLTCMIQGQLRIHVLMFGKMGACSEEFPLMHSEGNWPLHIMDNECILSFDVWLEI